MISRDIIKAPPAALIDIRDMAQPIGHGDAMSAFTISSPWETYWLQLGVSPSSPSQIPPARHERKFPKKSIYRPANVTSERN